MTAIDLPALQRAARWHWRRSPWLAECLEPADLVQMAALRLLQGSPRADPSPSLVLCRVGQDLARQRNGRRETSPRRGMELLPLPQVQRSELGRVEAAAPLSSALLEALSERDRRIVELRACGLPFGAIAPRVGLSVGAHGGASRTGVRYRRALLRLEGARVKARRSGSRA